MMPFRPTQPASKMIFVREEGKRKKQKKSWHLYVPVIQALSHSEQMPSYPLRDWWKLIPAADHPA
jgi:hypothetical protein